MFENERITFDAPPVKEVALGRTFLFRPDFVVPYYGAFWQRVKDRYPTTEQADTILDPTNMEASFSPRVFFVAPDSRSLVQLQQDRFHFNWRQTDEPVEYVRFPAIQAECLGLWGEFDAFVRELTGRPLQPVKGELTYTNIVDLAEGETAFDVAQMAMRDSLWAPGPRFLKVPKTFTHSYGVEIPDSKSVLQVNLGAARRVLTNKPPVDAFKIELTVRGACGVDNSFEQWSQQAHDFLVKAFKDLTTPEMHRRWKLRGTNG